MLEYNSLKICTNVFFFDGASNVLNAGEVLMAMFPHTFCFQRENMLFRSSSHQLRKSSQLRFVLYLCNLIICNQLTHLLFCLSHNRRQIRLLHSLWYWDKNGFMVMVLCHDASLVPKAAAGGNDPSTKNVDLTLNDCVRAAVIDAIPNF